MKKIENPIYVRNVDGTFNKERLIENIVEVNIYYQGHRERTEINVIGRQKWNVILGILWLTHHNPERRQGERKHKREEKEKKRPRKERTIEVKRMAEEWEI